MVTTTKSGQSLLNAFMWPDNYAGRRSQVMPTAQGTFLPNQYLQ